MEFTEISQKSDVASPDLASTSSPSRVGSPAPLAASMVPALVPAPADDVEMAVPHAEEALPAVQVEVKTKNFYDYTLPQLEQILVNRGQPKFRAEQVFKWVYERRIENFDEMSNVSKAFRADLPSIFHFELPRVVQNLKSQDGTRKWLFDIGDGMTIETVLIPNKDRLTLCVSSEVGCNIACRFCFTGKQKLKRRLTTGQIVGQFLHAQDSLKAEGLRVTNIVFMGMGEPLDNADAVFDSIKILHEPNGQNFSRRKVTVSTSGIVPMMSRIHQAGVRLAVSLNAPNNEIRDFVMPINKRWNVHQLLDACREHVAESRDRVTFEYVLLKDVTDRLAHARELWDMVKDIPCKINLIPFNEHPGAGFERPERASVVAFQNELIRLGAHVLVRKTMGRDIFAACGQLTSVYEGRPVTMDLGARA